MLKKKKETKKNNTYITFLSNVQRGTSYTYVDNYTQSHI